MIPGPVVVLGGGGFIGSHLCRRLMALGYDVASVDLQRGDHDASRRKADLLDGVPIRGAGTVFHLAADMGGVGYFHSDADLGASMRNGRMTLNVIEACMAAGVERLVYTSSACAYPIGAWEFALREYMLGQGTPDALYGAEKLHGLRLMEKVPGARVVVLDTIYGPGSVAEGPRAKMPASVAYKAIQARQTGKLELWGDGWQERRLLYVDDAVDRIVAVAGAVHYDGPVNITGAVPICVGDVARLCLRLTGADELWLQKTGSHVDIVCNGGGPTGVQRRAISGEKFQRLYGLADEVSYDVGFGALIEWLDR